MTFLSTALQENTKMGKVWQKISGIQIIPLFSHRVCLWLANCCWFWSTVWHKISSIIIAIRDYDLISIFISDRYNEVNCQPEAYNWHIWNHEMELWLTLNPKFCCAFCVAYWNLFLFKPYLDISYLRQSQHSDIRLHVLTSDFLSWTVAIAVSTLRSEYRTSSPIIIAIQFYLSLSHPTQPPQRSLAKLGNILCHNIGSATVTNLITKLPAIRFHRNLFLISWPTDRMSFMTTGTFWLDVPGFCCLKFYLCQPKIHCVRAKTFAF